MALKGSSAWLEQPGSRGGWKSSTGAYEERVWEGPTATLSTFLSGAPGGFSEYHKEVDGELTRVRLVWSVESMDGVGTGSEDGLIDDTWELEGNDLEKSLWEIPKIMAYMNTLTYETAKDTRNAIQKFIDGELDDISFPADPAGENLKNLIKRLASGVEAFSVSQYVLRHVQLVTRNSTLSPAYTNIAKIHTYSQLTTAEPTLATANLVAAAGLDNLKWLKRTPKIRPVSRGLWELEQEYWGADDWDIWIWEVVP